MLSDEFGSQCIVISIQAKKRSNYWEALTHCGRVSSGLDVVEWMEITQKLGAGEIILTSVDCDGTMNGMDLDLIRAISGIVDIPLIVSGGFSEQDSIIDIASNKAISGIAIGASLHRKKVNINELKNLLNKNGIKVRI